MQIKDMLKRLKLIEKEMDEKEAEADVLYREVYELSDRIANAIVIITGGHIDKVTARMMMTNKREDVERILNKSFSSACF